MENGESFLGKCGLFTLTIGNDTEGSDRRIKSLDIYLVICGITRYFPPLTLLN